MSVYSIWRAEELGQTKITDLQYPIAIHQQIVGLQVSVEDPVCVQIVQASQSLNHVGLDVCRGENYTVVLNNHLQVGVHKVENEGHIRLVTKNVWNVR